LTDVLRKASGADSMSAPAPLQRLWRRLAAGLLLLWACPAPAVVDGPGDDRSGYERPDFETRSRTIEARQGMPADLVARARGRHLGLPALEWPADNPLTAERVALGRKLFFDRRLSLNGTQSCGICHIPEQGFTNNELATAVGIEGRAVGRNTPTLYNVAFLETLFHDGREETLEQQAWQPMLHPNEMANPSIGFVIERLRSLPDYAGRFEAAFDGGGPDLETVPKALASYQRTLVSANSAFDRWHYGGEADAMDDAAIRGFALFTDRAGCVACHTIEHDHALFTDQRLHNTGVGFARSQRSEPGTSRVWLAPGVSIDVSARVIHSVGEERTPDLGRYRVTGDPDDRWRFRTPSLRNVALTAPYMHDGSLPTLDAVVAFYDTGGTQNPLLSPLIRPLGLSASEREDLVAFLRALTGEYRGLVLDAFAAPLGDVGIERRPPAAALEDE
jgi:cytochrome c peroxidase